jgi:hypothetical protein
MAESVASRPSPAWPLLPLCDHDRCDAFLARLARMTPEERIRVSRHEFKRWELHVWAGHYPDEVPLIDGEFEWIAMRSVDTE